MNLVPLIPDDFSSQNSIAGNPLRGLTDLSFLRNETLDEIFAATVAKSPKQIAMIEGERKLSYAQVDQSATAIARGLVAQGVGPGDVVGLYLPRGADLLVAQIAIAKTGAAWLPFDSETPRDRISVCLSNAKARGLLTTEEFAKRLPDLQFQVWPITGPIAKPGKAKLVDPRTRGHSAQSIAYMIYTSGSTGVPKGIAITHQNICHYLRASNSMFGITNTDVMFQGCSVAFDLSMEEIWIPLMVGATLWVVNGETLADTEALPGLMRKAGVTAIDTVPTLLALLMGDVPTLRTVIVGGEACPPSLVARFATGGRRLFNSYGPTETTVVATVAELEPGFDVTFLQPPGFEWRRGRRRGVRPRVNLGDVGVRRVCGPDVCQRRSEGPPTQPPPRDHHRHRDDHRHLRARQRRLLVCESDRKNGQLAADCRRYHGRAVRAGRRLVHRRGGDGVDVRIPDGQHARVTADFFRDGR